MAWSLGTWNVRGLELAGRSPWPQGRPLDHAEAEGKLAFLSQRILAAAPTCVVLQELGSPAAFQALWDRVRSVYPFGFCGENGSEGLLRNALLSTVPWHDTRSVGDLPQPSQFATTAGSAPVCTRFRRGIVRTTLELEPRVTVLGVHLKSGTPEPSPHDSGPWTLSQGMARAAAIRVAEAVGLRAITETERPSGSELVLAGDFNDVPGSPTLRMLTYGPPGGAGLAPTAGLARAGFERHTHLGDGSGVILDQVLCSPGLVPRFRDLVVQNDTLKDAVRDRRMSDHAFVIAHFD